MQCTYQINTETVWVKPLFTVIATDHHCSFRLLADAIELRFRQRKNLCVHGDHACLRVEAVLFSAVHAVKGNFCTVYWHWNDDLRL